MFKTSFTGNRYIRERNLSSISTCYLTHKLLQILSLGYNRIEAEDNKKRWQEYTEELYKKDLHDPDNHDGVITHLMKPGGPRVFFSKKFLNCKFILN